MSMPLDLVLVRHGESEGNVARKFSDGGDDSIFTEEFRNRHNSRLRLTERGKEQAHAAGDWIRENIGECFHRYLVSGFLRAMETAALLNLPSAEWYQDFYLRERDLGLFDIMPEAEKQAKYPDVFRQYRLDPFYWAPPQGESMAQLCLRIDRVLQTLHRECSEKKVIIVCHGLVMWAFMIRIERLTPTQFVGRTQSDAIVDKIRNGQIMQYTRRDPAEQTLSPRADWVRSVCPWETARSRVEWRKIERPRWTNADLLELVEASPRIVA
jgi:NAD+ kinase